jgi:threonyl-tRNA synthetase
MKTEQNQMETVRHSISHLMSMAVQEIYPQVGLGVGPAIEDGFYQDYDLPEPITPDILPKLEKRMRELIKQNIEFKQHDVDFDEAYKFYKHDPYKTGFIDDLKAKGEKQVSFYKSDWFDNLCAGPHVKSTKEIDPKAFKLTRIAGAYWRGDEKNKMLTRIYGLAFATPEELTAHLTMLAEAEKRDHRKIGKELELFTFAEEIGAGLPIWLPKGTIIKDELEKLAKEQEELYGYQRVSTPLITKEDLFYTSGHLPHYADSMYAPMEIDGEKYYLKPMNCPFHHTIYKAKPHSYRELPIRYAEYGLCHRYEKSGELQGLMRVRSLMMNDAHIYVRPDQVKDELKKVLELHQYYYNLFGIDKVTYRLSLHDPKDLGGKYVDKPKEWQENEQILREVLQEMKMNFVEAENEASFYGPKIDINIYSIIGKEYTVGTCQLDFSQPQKFALTYINQDGVEVMPFCIHRAPLSTHERFVGFLIEHFAGNFPLWLSPVQVKILSVGENHIPYCEQLMKDFKAVNIRVELDDKNESVGHKIRQSSKEKIPYVLVIGDKEMNSQDLAVRVRGQEELLNIAQDKFNEHLQKLISTRSLEL